jgi:hypothetical protein
MSENPGVADDISDVTMSMLQKFPHRAAEALCMMSHGDLQYDDIRIGNKGACLIISWSTSSGIAAEVVIDPLGRDCNTGIAFYIPLVGYYGASQFTVRN